MESVPLLWRTVTASPVGIETMTILEGGGPKKMYDCTLPFVICDSGGTRPIPKVQDHWHLAAKDSMKDNATSRYSPGLSLAKQRVVAD